MMVAPGLSCHGCFIFLVTAVCPLYEIGIATHGRFLIISVGIHHYDPLPTQSGVETPPLQHRTLMSAIPPIFPDDGSQYM